MNEFKYKYQYIIYRLVCFDGNRYKWAELLKKNNYDYEKAYFYLCKKLQDIVCRDENYFRSLEELEFYIDILEEVMGIK